MAVLRQYLTYQGIPVWRHALIIQWAAQIASAILVVALVMWFFGNMAFAIDDREIPFGFSFLSREYQTPIGEHILPYESSDTFLYALVVAATNTVVVAVAGVILATLLGIFIGVCRLSPNWIVARLATVYIEFFRNVPLLVQLFFWFYIILALPTVREGYVIADLFYVNNAGISFPSPTASGAAPALVWLALAVVAVVAGVIVHHRLVRREEETGRQSYPFVVGCATTVGVAAVGWLVLSGIFGEAPFAVSTPAPQGRFGRIDGGVTIRAGMLVMLIGLVIYTASFIAEIVRAGIQSVGRGQTEAARALGLSPMNTLRQVTFPQALRVIIPPWISQCLNLTKNSSLGGVVGYTDLTNVAITMTQTAPAINIFLMLMAAYLAMSLTWSLIGNLYNRHIRFTG
ncbi:MAG: ABC transporter permease subunit [Chloroflexi bacterium]|nr:ABC transporter permease subunit [Chloroflexota bacterium]MYD47758.1 ABC transporter permease subunit [Chloroflexota bacterium]